MKKSDSIFLKVTEFTVALPVIVLLRIACVMPEKVSRAFGRLLARICCFCRIRRKTLLMNLQYAFPEMSDKELKTLIKKIYVNFGDFFFEWFSIPQNIESLDQRVTCTGLDCLNDAIESGKGVLICSAHLGNWEILATAIARYSGKPLTIIRNQLRNRYLDKWFTKLHNAQGFDDMHRTNSGIKMFRALKRNELIGMLVDQNGRSAGVWLPYFNRPSSFHRGPGIVASKTGCTVITVFCYPEKNQRWQLHFAALDTVLTGQPEEDTERVMSEYTRRLESAVQKHPEWYFWFHRRWKTKVPKHIVAQYSEQQIK